MQIDLDSRTTQPETPPFGPAQTRAHDLRPLLVSAGMLCVIFLLAAILPLAGLGFNDVLLTKLGDWSLLPTHLLFPGWPVVPGQPPTTNPDQSIAWLQLSLLLATLTLGFLLYLYALRHLPRRITPRFLLGSTLLFGLLLGLIPVVTSPDLFSYLSYARMGVIYHLNPLTTLPTVLAHDPVFPNLYWTDQPSAYGPVWAALSSLLQWSLLGFGSDNLIVPVLGLRLLGLLTHLGSTWLIWSIAGRLQQARGQLDPERRLRATLAFAWNPLLLFEACVNAHNDSTLLLLILLAIWLLVRLPQTTRTYLLVAAVLALATCLKINVGLLFPGYLLFLWTRPRRWPNLLATTTLYAGLIVLLYAPFWNNGVLLDVLRLNPSTYRSINSPAEFIGQLYNGLIGSRPIIAPAIGSPAERITHLLSLGAFALLYLLLCWRALRRPASIASFSGLLRWLALSWLLYCAIGTPWYWPWYIVTFFGLYALVEAVDAPHTWPAGPWRQRVLSCLRHPLTIRLLAFTTLTLYLSYSWAVRVVYIPGLPGFRLAYTRGLLAWGLPLLILLVVSSLSLRRSARSGVQTPGKQTPPALSVPPAPAEPPAPLQPGASN